MSFFITLEHDNSIDVVTGFIDFKRLILVTISCHMLKLLSGDNEHYVCSFRFDKGTCSACRYYYRITRIKTLSAYRYRIKRIVGLHNIFSFPANLSPNEGL